MPECIGPNPKLSVNHTKVVVDSYPPEPLNPWADDQQCIYRSNNCPTQTSGRNQGAHRESRARTFETSWHPPNLSKPWWKAGKKAKNECCVTSKDRCSCPRTL